MTSNTTGLPTYSPEAMFYLDELFFTKGNDINFYFEDENHEPFYERLLEKIFPDLKITKVFCLGGKSEVLKKVKANKGKEPNPQTIYIVDKDYDDLLGKVIIDKELIYLPKYSIENFLYDPNAFISILLDELKGVRKATLESELRLHDFYTSLINQLTPVARLFIVAQKFNTPLKSTKLDHNTFIKIAADGSYKVCEVWFKSYQESLLAAIQHFKELQDIDIAVEDAFNPDERFKNLADTSSDAHICGKHILLIIWDYISKKKTLNEIDPYSLSMRLLDKLDINRFNFLKTAIINVSGRTLK